MIGKETKTPEKRRKINGEDDKEDFGKSAAQRPGHSENLVYPGDDCGCVYLRFDYRNQYPRAGSVSAVCEAD